MEGVDRATQMAAMMAARKAGLSPGAWLKSAIREAAEEQLEDDDAGPDKDRHATADRRTSPAIRDGGGNGRPPGPNVRVMVDRLEKISRRLDEVEEQTQGSVPPFQARMDEMEEELKAIGAETGVSTAPLERVLAEPSERAQNLERNVGMKNVEKFIEQARSLHEAGRLDEAAELYQRIIADHPDHAEALNGLGVLAFQRRDLTVAAEYLSLAVESTPREASYHGNLGAAYAAMGRFDTAKSALERAVKLDPMAADIHSSLGAMHRGLGHEEAAVEACRRAIELNPELYEAHSNLALALLGLGRTEEAVVAAEAAVAANATDASAHNNLGAVMAALERWDEAHAQFHLAVVLDPTHDEARRNLDRLESGPRAPKTAAPILEKTGTR